MRTVKTKKVSLKAPPPSIFKAKVKKDPVYNQQAEIDKAAEELKKEEAEVKLLEHELEKPFHARNKAVVEKYGHIDPESVADNYPKLDQGIFYRIVERFPENRDIPLKQRPKKWHTSNEFAYRGNVFVFEFPMSYHGEVGGDRAFKLDHDGTTVDASGSIADEPFGLLAAISAWLAKNDIYSPLIKKVFLKYGILKETDDEGSIFTNPNLDFCVRGHHVSVKYTTIQVKSEPALTTIKGKTTPIDLPTQTVVVEEHLHMTDAPEGSDKEKKIEENTQKYASLFRKVGLKFHGIYDAVDDIEVISIYAPISYSTKYLVYPMFSSYHKESGKIYAEVAVTKELAVKMSGLTASKLIPGITVENQKVYNEYLAAKK